VTDPATPAPTPADQAEPRPSVDPSEAGVAEAGIAEAAPKRRRRGWRIARRVAVWTVAVVVVLALAATGFVVWSVRRAFPDVDGRLALPGLTAPVTVYRDAHGIPQLYAESAHDLFLAQGYVHAQDRFWEMDFRRHVTAGRTAELFGPDLVPTDAFLRTSGWRRVAEQEWDILAPDTRTYLQAYADGVNAWIQANGGPNGNGVKSLEYTVLGLTTSGYTVESWTPIDSLAWLKAMAWDLRGNMEQEIDRAGLLAAGLTREQIEQLYPTYPYDRHAPIVSGGDIVNGAFDASAPGAAEAGSDVVSALPASVWRDAAPALSAAAAAIRRVPTLLGDNASGDIGSNSWVIGGALTATGKPLLANDPHLSPSMPGIWYQMGLHCTCPYNVEGFTFSGVPGVVIGHNARVAWGFTNLNPDVSDLYVEKVDGDKVLDGTNWVPLTTRTETIKVAGGDPVTITVRSSKHGPLLSDRSSEMAGIAAAPPVDPSGNPRSRLAPKPTPSLDADAPGVPSAVSSLGYAVALRWTALDPGHTADALFVLNTASNWQDFRRAASMFEVPAQNLVYADVDGNIGYQSPGKVPVRGKGDGRWPAPGWDPAYDWRGYLPFAALPTVYNPPAGYIVTANQAVVGLQYHAFLTTDWDYGYRSQRIMDLIRDRTKTGKISAEDIRQIQFDNLNGFAPVVVDALKSVRGLPPAAQMLSTWDFQQPADSSAAALYNVFWRHLMMRTFDELPADHKPNGDDRWWEVMRSLLADPHSDWWDDRSTSTVEGRDDILVEAMDDAVGELTSKLGSDPAKWHWGDLHQLGLINQTFGTSGIAPVEWLFNRGPAAVSGGSSIVNATGWDANGPADDPYTVTAVPSMRMIVDLSNLDASRWVQLTGNSGHAFAANYDDQFDLWRTGQNLPMHWERASVQSDATHTLTLSPQ
jgi:penicillin amidase